MLKRKIWAVKEKNYALTVYIFRTWCSTRTFYKFSALYISDEIKNEIMEWSQKIQGQKYMKLYHVTFTRKTRVTRRHLLLHLLAKLLGFYEYPCVIWRKVIIAMHTYSSFFKPPYLTGNNTVKHISKQTFVITYSEHYVFFYHSHINCTT